MDKRMRTQFLVGLGLAAVLLSTSDPSGPLMAAGSENVLGDDRAVYVGDGRTELLSTHIVLNGGEGVYLYGRATAYSPRNNVHHLNILRLFCSGPELRGDYIQSTENHLVGSTQWLAARMLLVAPPTAPAGSVFTCELTVEVRSGESYHYLEYPGRRLEHVSQSELNQGRMRGAGSLRTVGDRGR